MDQTEKWPSLSLWGRKIPEELERAQAALFHALEKGILAASNATTTAELFQATSGDVRREGKRMCAP